MKEVKKLIDLGKEKGYLTYDDVNDMLPAEVVSPDRAGAAFHFISHTPRRVSRETR